MNDETPFDRGWLLSDCKRADRAVECAALGLRKALDDSLDELRVSHLHRNHHALSADWRALFQAREPGLVRPVKRLDAAIEVTRKRTDQLVAAPPGPRSPLTRLSRASAALRAALEGKPAAPAPRVVVHRKPPTVTLDNIHYPLTEAQAVFVDILVQNLDHLVQPATFDREPILDSVRRPRLKKKLPEPIRDLIEGFPGGGYKMTLP